MAQHLFGVKNIVVVHHTFCGATSFTANGIIEAFEKEQGRDIAKLYSRSSLCISDFKESLSQDVKLVRESAGTPSSVNIYGFLYDIDTTELTLVAEDAAIA